MSDAQLDKQFDSILRIQESKLERKLRANFNKMSKDMQRAYLDNGQFGADAVVSKNDEKLAEILLEAYKSGVIAGSGFAFNQVEEKNKKEQDSLAEEALLLLLALLSTEAIKTAQEINRTTQKIYNNIVDEVANNKPPIDSDSPTKKPQGLRSIFGSGADDNKQVADKLKKRNYTRAKSIATTEAQPGLQSGIEKTAEVMNEKALVVFKKKWRSQQDSKVRDSHARVNGQVKRLAITS